VREEERRKGLVKGTKRCGRKRGGEGQKEEGGEDMTRGGKADRKAEGSRGQVGKKEGRVRGWG